MYSFTVPVYSVSHKGEKNMLLKKKTLWKSNLKFVKNIITIDVKFITIVNRLPEKKKEALIVYRSSHYYCYFVSSHKRLDELSLSTFFSYSHIYFLLLPYFFLILFIYALRCHTLPGYSRQYSDSLRAERSGDRKPVGARFSLPLQTDLDTHPGSCRICTEAAEL